MRDGTVLRSDVYRPAAAGRYPTILGRTTYGKRTWGRWIDPERTASDGYVVVVNDMRGHFASDGVLDPFRTDVEDGYEAVEWCAEQPWSNGRVGMYGSSACGYSQLQAAVAHPPHLVAIAPMQTWSSFGRGCVYDAGGAFSMYTQEWALQQTASDAEKAIGVERPDFAEVRQQVAQARHEMGRWHAHLPIRELPPLPREACPWYFPWLDHPDHDDWWADRDVAPHLSSVDLPALHLVGWFDRFCKPTVANYLALRKDGRGAPQKLVIGPWPHGVPVITTSGDRFFGPRAEVDARSLLLRWYDHALRGIDNGVTEEPPVRLYLTGADLWQDASEWPPPESRPVRFHLRGDGAANTRSGDGRLERDGPSADEASDTYVYDPADPTPSVPGRLARPWGTVDQGGIEDRPDVLCFTTPPLQSDVDVIGSVSATIWTATDARDTDWLVKLVDVYPDGYVFRLAEGMIRARYRESQARQVPLEPGRVYRYDIDVGPVGNRFKAGHRIRVEIASASFPQYDRNMNTGAPFGIETSGVQARQRLLHDAEHPSHVILPMVSA